MSYSHSYTARLNPHYSVAVPKEGGGNGLSTTAPSYSIIDTLASMYAGRDSIPTPSVTGNGLWVKKVPEPQYVQNNFDSLASKNARPYKPSPSGVNPSFAPYGFTKSGTPRKRPLKAK